MIDDKLSEFHALPPRRDSCFFFNDTATTEIYTLSLHDALPISLRRRHHASRRARHECVDVQGLPALHRRIQDRKSTRLNSSHGYISYAVFCLKKKNRITSTATPELSSPSSVRSARRSRSSAPYR